MDIDLQVLEWLSRKARAHLWSISFAFFATLLAIYGQDINNAVRRRIGHHHLLVRTTLFIFLCAVGYGWLILTLSKVSTSLLRACPPKLLPLLIGVLFVGLGFVAERKKKI